MEGQLPDVDDGSVRRSSPIISASAGPRRARTGDGQASSKPSKPTRQLSVLNDKIRKDQIRDLHSSIRASLSASNGHHTDSSESVDHVTTRRVATTASRWHATGATACLPDSGNTVDKESSDSHRPPYTMKSVFVRAAHRDSETERPYTRTEGRLCAVRTSHTTVHQALDTWATTVITIVVASTLIMRHFQEHAVFTRSEVTVNPITIRHQVRSSHVDISIHTETRNIMESRILVNPLLIVGRMS